MAQMLICFSLLRFHKFGVGNRGGREGPNVAKMVNTDNPRPQRTVCRFVSGPFSAGIISLKKTAGLFKIAHFSQLSPVALTAITKGGDCLRRRGESLSVSCRLAGYLLQNRHYTQNPRVPGRVVTIDGRRRSE